MKTSLRANLLLVIRGDGRIVRANQKRFLLRTIPSNMTPTSLIIVTDRGTLKAYKVNETPTRGPSLKLVQAFDTTDAHGRYQDKLTDQAGASASGATPGQMNSIAERTGIDNENDRRIVKQLADSITDVVAREGKDGWSFAAPASIHSAVVEQLPAEVRDRIVEHVKSDLVKIEPAKLPSHFRSLQPIYNRAS
jgi:protein required for attachment to host cells